MENDVNVNAAGSWSLAEEVNLLEAMVIYGQDWLAISKRCEGRSPDECERHYYYHFIDNPKLVGLSDLLQKARENFFKCKLFLCPGLLSDRVCRCGETVRDNSNSPNLETIKEGKISSNMVEFERIYDSVGTSVNSGLSKITSISVNRCERFGDSSPSLSESGSFTNFSFHPADFHFLDSTCELECEKLLTESSQFQNNNIKKIKKEVEFDCNSTFSTEISKVIHCRTSTTLDTYKLNNPESACSSSAKNYLKLETDSVYGVSCSPDTIPLETKPANIHPNGKPSNTYSVSCPEKLPENDNSKIHGKRAGFDAYRTEFDVEFDNGAEETLNMLHYEVILETPDDDVDGKLLKELSLSVVEGYMHRLKERHRRKSLVQRFGLLDYSKIANYMKTVETTFGKRFAKRLVLLKRLFSSKEYDDFMKGYQRLNQLKSHLSTLCNYRERGITTLAAANLYEEMSKMRNESNKQIQAIPVVRRLENGESILGSTFRRPAPPIAVHEMPGYESLDKEEVDFCSIQRIAPKSFLEYKNTLINECQKRKCLKLAHARPLLKIDVNKTRKLYDLLLSKNLIWKDEKMIDQ